MNFNNVKKIIIHEWRDIFRNRIVAAAVGILTIAFIAALFVGWQNYRTYETERAKYQQTVADKWLNQPDRHPHRVAHYGYLIFRAKAELSFFDSGVESFAGNSIFLEAHKQNSANFSEAGHSSGLLRFGELTPAMILQLLVPLLIFFLGFVAITGERENGTLPILLSQNVSWREILYGKTLSIISIIYAILLPVAIAGFLFWLILSGGDISTDLVVRVLFIFTFYAVFFAVCVAISVLVSAFYKTSKSSLMTLIVVWILFFIVMPRFVQNLGAIIYETPSQSEFEKQIEEETSKEGDSHNPNDPKFAELKKQTLEKYNVSDVKDLPFNYGGFVMGKAEEISSRIFREHYGEVLEKFRLQNRVSEILGFINPYLAVRQISSAAAGSDSANYENFQWQAENYRFEMIQKLNKMHAEEIKIENDRGQKLSQKTWGEFPAFEYKPLSFAESLSRQILSVIAGILWLALVFASLWFYEPENI